MTWYSNNIRLHLLVALIAVVPYFYTILLNVQTTNYNAKSHVIEGRLYAVVPAGSCCQNVRWTFETAVVAITGIVSTTWFMTGFDSTRTVLFRQLGLVCILVSLLIPGIPVFSARLDAPTEYVDHYEDVLDLIVETLIVHREPLIAVLVMLIAFVQSSAAIIAASGLAVLSNSMVLVLATSTIPILEMTLRAVHSPLLVHPNGQPYQITFQYGAFLLVTGAFLIFSGALLQGNYVGRRLTNAIFLCALVALSIVFVDHSSSKKPTWTCQKVAEVTNRDDLITLHNISQHTFPFVVRGAINSFTIDRDSLVTACPNLQNTARSDIVPHANALKEPMRSLFSFAMWCRYYITGSGFYSVDALVRGYPSTLKEYNDLMSHIRPIGSLAILDRILFAINPGIAYATDISFQNDNNHNTLLQNCPLFMDTYRNLKSSWPQLAQENDETGVHIFMTRVSQQWTMTHHHKEHGNENWRWTWQIRGRKRWRFWPDDAGRMLMQQSGFVATKPNCCDNFGFTEHFGPASAQSMAALEALPCYEVDLNPGDIFAFETAMPHSVYSLDSEDDVMISTATILRPTVKPITLSE